MLTSRALDVFSQSTSRNDAALMVDSKVYALARNTKEQRQLVRNFFIRKSTLVRVFDDIERIRTRTGVDIKVMNISESVPQQPRRRAPKGPDDDPDEPAPAPVAEVPQLPQPKGIASITIALELRGKQESLIDTIRLLELLPAVSNLQSVSLRARTADGPGSGEWVSSVLVFIPTLPETVSTRK